MDKFTVFNAESAYFYFREKDFRRSILGSNPMYCDSISLSIVLRIRGVPHERLHGPDFMEHYLRSNLSQNIMIIGGSDQAHEKICVNYELENVRFVDRRISVDDLDTLFDEITAFEPKMVFVCLGLRKQEAVVDAIWQYFNDDTCFEGVSVIGVGAAVDFLGGTKARSGRVWQKLGLEWLPRLMREPRMAPRILRSLVGCILTLTHKQKFDADNLSFAEKIIV
jgi:N-acetylglucosaminyldiphosphoundecaprenol N-acetyl-beta-D-mannosaminyltransferase